MRKILFATMLLIAMSYASALDVSLINPSIYPLSSNQPFTITITAFNGELSEFNDLTIGIEASYPFITVGGETYERRVGDLQSLKSAYATFRLKTSENVPEGSYAIRAYYCSGSCTTKTIANLDLQFIGNEDVRLLSQAFSTNLVFPNNETTLTLTIKNYGTGKVRDASLKINNSINGIIPIIFTNNSNDYFIGDIPSNSQMSVAFKLLFNDELSPGVYSLPVYINTPASSTKIGELNFEISSKSEMIIPLIETEPAIPVLGAPLTIIATIENTGSGTAKSVVATLESNGKKISANYIGKVDSGDDDVAIFEITQGDSKDYQVKIAYSDDLGSHETVKELSVDYKIVADLSWIQNLLIVIIVIGAGFYFYKRKKKKT